MIAHVKAHSQTRNDRESATDGQTISPKPTAPTGPTRDSRSQTAPESPSADASADFAATTEPPSEETRFLKSQLNDMLAEARRFVAYCQADADVWNFVSDPGRLLIQSKLAGQQSDADRLLHCEFQVARLRQTTAELIGNFESPTIRLLAQRAAIGLLIENWLDQLRVQSELTLPQARSLCRRQEVINGRIARYLKLLNAEKKLELAAKRQRHSTNPRPHDEQRRKDVGNQDRPSPVSKPCPESTNIDRLSTSSFEPFDQHDVPSFEQQPRFTMPTA